MKLKQHIADNHGTQRAFAINEGVQPAQVTKWLKQGCIVVDGVLYYPRRALKPIEKIKG